MQAYDSILIKIARDTQYENIVAVGKNEPSLDSNTTHLKLGPNFGNHNC